MNDPFDLTGKVAVITGSSRGIGRAIAERLAQRGARVVVSSRNQDICDDVAGSINAAFGEGSAIAVAASISSKEAIEDLIRTTRERLGPVDILVCNAASNPHYGSLDTIDDARLRSVRATSEAIQAHRVGSRLQARDRLAQLVGHLDGTPIASMSQSLTFKPS